MNPLGVLVEKRVVIVCILVGSAARDRSSRGKVIRYPYTQSMIESGEMRLSQQLGML